MSFWSRIFNSECSTCEVLKEQLKLERERAQACPTCDTLKVQIGIEQAKLREFTDHILHPPTPEIPSQVEMPKPIEARHIPWSMQQARLEAQSKKKHTELVAKEEERATKLAEDKAKEIVSTAGLEKELGVATDG